MLESRQRVKAVYGDMVGITYRRKTPYAIAGAASGVWREQANGRTWLMGMRCEADWALTGLQNRSSRPQPVPGNHLRKNPRTVLQAVLLISENSVNLFCQFCSWFCECAGEDGLK